MDDIERKLRDLGERTAREAPYREAPAGRIVRRARLRRALTMAAPAVAVALVAGVALPRVDWPGGRAESSTATLASAIGATGEAGTARVDVEFEFQWDSDVATSHATGVIDFDTGWTRLEVTYSDDGQERVVEMVTDGTRTFERPLGSDDKWSERSLPPGAAAGPPDSNPREFLDYIESVASEVTRVGTDIRDGESMTRYRALIDPAKVEAASPQEVPDDLQLEYDPMDVWVDEQGRFREVTFGGAVTMDDFEQTMRGTMRLYDFGVEADIELPSPDEITDEPPSSWGGPGGELIGSEDSGDRSSTTMIMGEDRIDAPYVEVDFDGSAFTELCVNAEPGVTGAALVQESSGRRVFAFEPMQFGDGHFEGVQPVACVEEPFPPSAINAVIEHPGGFTLSVDRKGGSTEIVRLTVVAKSIGG